MPLHFSGTYASHKPYVFAMRMSHTIKHLNTCSGGDLYNALESDMCVVLVKDWKYRR